MPEDANSRTSTIVVGVDGSDQSRLAVNWACDEAARRGSLLRILFAESRPPRHLPPWYEADATGVTAGQAVVDDAAALVATRNPEVLARAEVVERAPAAVLTEASRSADLLVVGARGVGGFQGLLLGSVSDQCIQYSYCPVVVVSEGPDQLPGQRPPHLVVGIDGSFDSSLALHWALDEARIRSASVEAIYAWQYPPIGAFVLGPTEGFEAAGQELVDGANASRDRWAPDVPFHAVAHFGPVVPSLLEASGGADLLVLGSGGHGTFREALLGSVAHQCARHASGAVVIIRPPVASVERSLADAVSGDREPSGEAPTSVLRLHGGSS